MSSRKTRQNFFVRRPNQHYPLDCTKDRFVSVASCLFNTKLSSSVLCGNQNLNTKLVGGWPDSKVLWMTTQMEEVEGGEEGIFAVSIYAVVVTPQLLRYVFR